MPRYQVDRVSNTQKELERALKVKYLCASYDGDGHIVEFEVDFELTDEQVREIERIVGGRLVRVEQ